MFIHNTKEDAKKIGALRISILKLTTDSGYFPKRFKAKGANNQPTTPIPNPIKNSITVDFFERFSNSCRSSFSFPSKTGYSELAIKVEIAITKSKIR